MHDDVELKPAHLPTGVFGPGPAADTFFAHTLPTGSFPLETHIHEIVEQALRMNAGNKKRTAEYLQISRRSLYTYLTHMERTGCENS